MAYCGMKKEDIEDTSMERHWKSARPAKAWNPFGQLPAPQRGGGGEGDESGEEESCSSNNALNVCVAVPPPPSVITWRTSGRPYHL
jgi:hypothetical protein